MRATCKQKAKTYKVKGMITFLVYTTITKLWTHINSFLHTVIVIQASMNKKKMKLSFFFIVEHAGELHNIILRRIRSLGDSNNPLEGHGQYTRKKHKN